MKKNRTWTVYTLSILLGLSILLSLIVVKNVTDPFEPKLIAATPPRNPDPSPASRYMYYPTPFYYPFKVRPTHMIGMTPFTQDFGYYSRQNSSGFPTVEYTIAHPPDTMRILIIGSSLSCGVNLPMQDTYPMVTETILNKKCNKFKTEIITLCTGINRISDDVIKLLVHGQWLNPDLVIFQISSGDIDFYQYFSILSLLGTDNIYASYAEKRKEVLDENSLDWRIFLESLQIIQSWSKEKSIPVAFLGIPPVDYRKDGRNFDHYNPQAEPYFPEIQAFQKIIRTAKEFEPRALSLLETFREKAGDHYLPISFGILDLNSFTHNLIANELSSFLIQQSLFNCDQYKSSERSALWRAERRLRDRAADRWFNFHNNFQRQIDFYTSLKRMYPKDSWIAAHLANAYFTSAKCDDAYTSFSNLTALAPEYTAPWFQMALCAGDGKVTRQLLEKMIQTVPDHTPSMDVLIDLYLISGEKERACTLLNRLKEIPTYQSQYDKSKKLFEDNRCAHILGLQKDTEGK